MQPKGENDVHAFPNTDSSSWNVSRAFSGVSGPRTTAVNDVKILSDAGIAVVSDFMSGTHEWHVWRILLKDFLTHTAEAAKRFSSEH